jgi:uncharacterized protein YbaP (TraB family)
MISYSRTQGFFRAIVTVVVLFPLTNQPAAAVDLPPGGQQAEIRYVDVDKGERNRPVAISHIQRENNTHFSRQDGKLLLWRIEHPDPNSGIRSSYILGTIHLDDSRVMDIPASIMRRLHAAKTLMLELEINEINSAETLRKMLFTDGRDLPHVVGGKQYSRISSALADAGVRLPDNVLSLLKPWAAMLMLIRPSNESGTFLDKKLAMLASRSNIQVLGLETINEQLSVFDQIPLDDQVELLLSAIQQLPRKEESYRKILDAYLSGDLERIVSMSAEQEPEDARLASLLRQKLILDRNRKMYSRMQKYLHRGNVFVAVGALHLPGDEGILQMLSDDGYRLSRIGIND